MGQNGDKMPDFWIFQFWGEDGRYIKIAETEDMNTVRTSQPRYQSIHKYGHTDFELSEKCRDGRREMCSTMYQTYLVSIEWACLYHWHAHTFLLFKNTINYLSTHNLICAYISRKLQSWLVLSGLHRTVSHQRTARSAVSTMSYVHFPHQKVCSQTENYSDKTKILCVNKTNRPTIMNYIKSHITLRKCHLNDPTIKMFVHVFAIALIYKRRTGNVLFSYCWQFHERIQVTAIRTLIRSFVLSTIEYVHPLR